MIIYISGPMSGLPELNFPAFAKAATRLRAAGYTVISPAEIEQPVLTWEACMRKDIKQLMDADVVATLSDYEQSTGALIETHLARSLQMEIHPVEYWLRLRRQPSEDELADYRIQEIEELTP